MTELVCSPVMVYAKSTVNEQVISSVNDVATPSVGLRCAFHM